MKRLLLTTLTLCITHYALCIEHDIMQRIYQEVRTPYKYGMVVAPSDNSHKIDCPTVFRENGRWYMTYVVYNGKDGLDGRGYETWLAESEDLLHWNTKGRILAYPDEGKQHWDQNQRGGFPALIDYQWGGSYKMLPYKGRHWMTYIGGAGTGYEAVRAPLSIGIATTKDNITTAHQWETYEKPLMSYDDQDAQWWEQLTQYKSTIYWIKDKKDRLKGEEKYPFVMFYNAGGKDDSHPKGERIGIALSKDMKIWHRYAGNPVFAHDSDGTITGDAQIVKMGASLYVMFYFSAYNPARKYNAYNTFAVSRDLIHWTDWQGDDLIIPSKDYDNMFAHKSYVVKHDGVVYHFYCAVNKAGQRGIAVATSVPMGRSEVRFPEPEPKGRRIITNLNDNWQTTLLSDSTGSVRRDSFVTVNLPHNFDDYYGYRQLKHGNLHGSAIYQKVFTTTKVSGRRYFLQFEGIGTYATVTLNGHSWARTPVGRTTYTLDITDYLTDGDNQLSVRCDHPAMITDMPWVCGGCSSEWGFSEGSQPLGIFRPVTLQETADVRVEPFGVHVWNNENCDSVFIETEVKNYSSLSRQIEFVSKMTKADGKTAFRLPEKLTLQAGETKTIYQQVAISDVHRWNLDDPYLYTLTSIIKDENNRTIDETTTEYGIRSISWPVHRQKQAVSILTDHVGLDTIAPSDNRFYLNGKPVFINGTCEYEHLLGNSHAFTPEQIRSRIKQITNAGFNAFREAHQPHNLLYQQLLDEQGILFWSQFSAHIWYDTTQFRENFKHYLRQWIKERRNSPSIILWGLQNESVLPKEFAEECSDIIREMDPTARTMRAITTCNGGEGTDWNVIQNWSGTYGGSAENYDQELMQPNQLLNGEYGAWRTIDLHGDAKYSEESFTKLLETKARLAEKAFGSTTAGSDSPAAVTSGVCGHFQWIFSSHDNPGRVQPDGALRRIDKIGPINYKGLTTIWEEPTPAYYMYKQRYTKGSPLPTSPDWERSSAGSNNSESMKVSPSGGRLEGANYLYRINCGGDSYKDEFGQWWQADDTLYSHSWGQDFGMHPYQASQRHITDEIRGTQSDELFQFFRFGRHRLWYDLPVPDGDYRVELYFVEPWHGKEGSEQGDYEGMRIFDVAINGETVIDDLDPWAEAGYCGAIKRVVSAKAKNGRLHIAFPEVKAGQAVICAIAISSLSPLQKDKVSPKGGDIEVASHFWHNLDTDTIAKLPKELLPKDTESRTASVYEPASVSSGKSGGTLFVIKPGLGQEYALRFKYKNTTGDAVKTRLTITDSKRSVLVDRDITFPATPNKFKILSTTTGTQINAGTYTVRISSPEIEFKELEIQ